MAKREDRHKMILSAERNIFPNPHLKSSVCAKFGEQADSHRKTSKVLFYYNAGTLEKQPQRTWHRTFLFFISFSEKFIKTSANKLR